MLIESDPKAGKLHRQCTSPTLSSMLREETCLCKCNRSPTRSGDKSELGPLGGSSFWQKSQPPFFVDPAEGQQEFGEQHGDAVTHATCHAWRLLLTVP